MAPTIDPQAFNVDALAAACRALAPTPQHDSLLDAARRVTGLDLTLACVDADWYRLGGVVDAEGRRIADDLEDWVAAETGGDVAQLYARYGDSGYRFTRHTGRRLYLTAALGPAPLDFVQVEIDQVQERICRPLFEGEAIPDSINDLESLPIVPNAVPLTAPSYLFRRATSFAAMPELTSDHKGDPRLRRFAADWAASSAGASAHFSERWALRVTPYRNADGEHVLEGRPVASLQVTFPDLQAAREHAVDYHPARSVLAVDREAGFPMAWYFLQVARHYAHYRCIVDVRDDFSKGGPGIPPLPAADARIVEQWIDDPYNFH